MKIYIDNVQIRFVEHDFHVDAREYSFRDFFTKYPDIEGQYFNLRNFRKDQFINKLPYLLTKRPDHPMQINIQKQRGLNVYDEITKTISAEPAAGGFVKKGDKFLMIKRLGKWDLPKGKIEDGEDRESAALREVKEECGVDANSLGFLCETHHMYMRKGHLYIKKTSWFLMECVDDNNMHGQEEEGITEVNWFDRKMVETNLIHSYGNIEDVFLNYLRLEESRVDRE